MHQEEEEDVTPNVAVFGQVVKPKAQNVSVIGQPVANTGADASQQMSSENSQVSVLGARVEKNSANSGGSGGGLGQVVPTAAFSVHTPSQSEPVVPTTATPPSEPIRFGKPVQSVIVSSAELAIANPGVSQDVLEQASRELAKIFPHRLTAAECSTIGSVNLERYSRLVDESLKLTQSQVLKDAVVYNNRLFELLNSISKAVKDKGKKVSLWKTQTFAEYYQSVQQELVGLLLQLKRVHNQLRNVQEKMQANLSAMIEVRQSILVNSVIIAHLASIIDSQDARSHQLAIQLSSTVSALANVQSGISLREAGVNMVDSMADNVQNLANVSIPAWQDQIGGILLNSTLSETDLITIGSGLDQIINNFKKG